MLRNSLIQNVEAYVVIDLYSALFNEVIGSEIVYFHKAISNSNWTEWSTVQICECQMSRGTFVVG